MVKDIDTVEQLLPLLAAAPARIAALTAGLTAVQLRTPPGPDEWSAVDVLAHLRACADVWGGYITRILSEDHPAFRAVSPRSWPKQEEYRQLDFLPSWHAFTAQRADLLATLEALPPEAWLRAATVKSVGRVLEHTVFYYAQRLTDHEQQHLKQFAQLAEAQYGR
jgi:hypothetical protein